MSEVAAPAAAPAAPSGGVSESNPNLAALAGTSKNSGAPVEGDAPETAAPESTGPTVFGGAPWSAKSLSPEAREQLIEIEKVNGETVTITLGKALENARLGTAAFRKLDEAANIRKESEQKVRDLEDKVVGFVDRLDSDPLSVIRSRGREVEDRLFQAIREELRREALPEAERRAYDLDSRDRSLAERERRIEAEERKRVDAQKQAQTAQQRSRAVQVLSQALTEAGVEEADIDAGVRRTWEIISSARRNGMEMTPADAAKLYAEELEEKFRRQLRTRKAADLAPLLEDGQRNDLHRTALESIARVRPANSNGAPPAKRAASDGPASDSMSREEYRAYLDKMSRA